MTDSADASSRRLFTDFKDDIASKEDDFPTLGDFRSFITNRSRRSFAEFMVAHQDKRRIALKKECAEETLVSANRGINLSWRRLKKTICEKRIPAFLVEEYDGHALVATWFDERVVSIFVPLAMIEAHQGAS